MSGAGAGGRYVVTGAASGIGREVALALLARGDAVVAVDRDPAVPPGCELLRCDLADPVSVAGVVAAVRAGGPVQGLANVAGVPGTAPADLVLAVNFLAARALTEGLLDLLPPDGSVVHLASLAARRPGVDEEAAQRLAGAADDLVREHVAAAGLGGPATYDFSKRLLVLHALGLAARLAGRGPRANSVSPGPVLTPILDDFRVSMGETVEGSAAVVGRHARPEEVAAAVVFLLSPQASWVNGVDLVADGGLLAARIAAKAAAASSAASSAGTAGATTGAGR